MSANTWSIISIVGFSLSGIALVAAIIMFFKLKIPNIIGDLSGKNVAREIQAMRAANISSGDKRFRSSRVNQNRGKLTEQMVTSSNNNVQTQQNQQWQPMQNFAADSGMNGTEVLSDNATEVLSDNATDVLYDNATELLYDNATEVLTSGATTILSDAESVQNEEETPVSFWLVRNMIVIHSQEVI